MITCWPSVYEPEKGRPTSLSALVRRIEHPHPSPAKGATARWAAAEFRRHQRSLACFIRAEAIVLDVDRAIDPHDRGTFYQVFAGLTAWAHTTWTAPRWRIVVPLDRAVDLAEFRRVQRAVMVHAERWGIFAERGQSAAHCFALPCTGGQPYAWAATDGPYWDVEASLAEYHEPSPMRQQERPQDAPADDRLARASLYLETMPGAVSGSGGHRATFRAAVVLVRGFGLPAQAAFELLMAEFNPRCDPPWSPVEMAHKVKEAGQRGKLPFGWLLSQNGRSSSAAPASDGSRSS